MTEIEGDCSEIVGLWRQPWRCALLNVIEDLADELWIGDIGNDTKLSATAFVSLFFRRCPGIACVGTIAWRMGELGAKTPW